MARKPITMRYVRDILRLKHQNQLSVREIAGSCGLPTSTVGDYLQRSQAVGLSWPLPEGMSDPELAGAVDEARHRPAGDLTRPSLCQTGRFSMSNCGAKA